MPEIQLISCPHCGANYQLTDEYLAQYGGQESQCHQCHNPFLIPRPGEVAIPVAQAYAGQVPHQSGAVAVIPYMGPNYQDNSGVWHDGNRIIVISGAVLPARCVKCNGAVQDGPYPRKLYWHHPLLFLTILAGVLVYAIVALCVRKTGTVTVSLCHRHVVRRRWIIFVAWFSIPLAIAMFILAGNLRNNVAQPILIILGIVTLLTGLIGGVIGARIVVPSKIEGQYLWLKGAGPEFLSTLSAAR